MVSVKIAHILLQSNIPRNISYNRSKCPLAVLKLVQTIVSLMKFSKIITKCILIPHCFHRKMQYNNRENANVLKIKCSKTVIVGFMNVMVIR